MAASPAGHDTLRSAAFERAAVGLALVDVDGVILEVNEAFCCVLGRRAGDLGGMRFEDLLSPAPARVGQEPEGPGPAPWGACHRRQIRCPRPEGEELWTELSISPLQQGGGGVGAWLVTLLEATEAVQTRRLLEQREHQFRLLAEHSSDVVLLVSGGRMHWLSPSLAPTLGWHPEEWQGKELQEFLHPEDTPMLARLQEEIGRGLSTSTRLRLRDRLGHHRWIEFHGAPCREPEGEGPGLVASFRTVEREVEIEAELVRRAGTDDLTGLLNRQAMFSRLEVLHGQMRRSSDSLAFLFCQIDQFREFNDRYGHENGDLVLQAIASRLRVSIRTGDLAARIGGGELLVVLERVQAIDLALQVAGKIRSVASAPVTLVGSTVIPTLTIGAALGGPAESIDAVVARAEGALDRVRHQGRNQLITIP